MLSVVCQQQQGIEQFRIIKGIDMLRAHFARTCYALGLFTLFSCSQAPDSDNDILVDRARQPDETDMLFVSNQDGDREIFTFDIHTRSLKQLTTNNRDDFDAKWSPNGEQIVFSSNRDGGNSDIYLMNADGSDQVNLSNHSGMDGYPNWSPDGKRIVFSSERSGNVEVFIQDLKSREIQQITNVSGHSAISPSWSPDGAMIVYTLYDESGKATTHLVDVETTETWPVTSHPKIEDGTAAWSPDGDYLLYHSRRDRQLNIYVYDINTKKETQLTDLATNDLAPVWSHDGQNIAFVSTRGDFARTQVCTMNVDGSEQECITDARYQSEEPTWLEDDSGLLFTSWEGARVSNVFLYDSKTLEYAPLSPADGYQNKPAPRPVPRS